VASWLFAAIRQTCENNPGFLDQFHLRQKIPAADSGLHRELFHPSNEGLNM
jgi:hypothetical protein